MPLNIPVFLPDESFSTAAATPEEMLLLHNRFQDALDRHRPEVNTAERPPT